MFDCTMAGQKRPLQMCDSQYQETHMKRPCLSQEVFNQHGWWPAVDNNSMECENSGDSDKENTCVSMEDLQNECGASVKNSSVLPQSHFHANQYDLVNGDGLYPDCYTSHVSVNGNNDMITHSLEQCNGQDHSAYIDPNGYSLEIGTTNNNNNSEMSVCPRCQAGEPGHIGHIGR